MTLNPLPSALEKARFDELKARALHLSDIALLQEKVQNLEAWRTSTEADLKGIREIISQVKLLMNLSIGGGALSIISLVVTIAALASLLK
jgi:hypothetical protein